MSILLSVLLDTRRMKMKTKKYPVKLRITFEREVQYYQTIFDLSKEEYKRLSSSRISEDLKKIRDQLRSIERDAEAAVDPETFSFTEFEKDYILNNPLFHQRKSIKQSMVLQSYQFDMSLYLHRFPIFKEDPAPVGTIKVIFLSYIDKLLREHRIRTAVNYQTSYYAIAKFKGNLRFSDITVTYLREYEQWMLQQDYSKTTIGIYIRSLRAIFNEAAENKIIKKEKCYPFGKRRYQIPTSRNVKKSLTLQDVGKIYKYTPECEQESMAKDFWLFSYLANGMNCKDIAFLKYKNIEEEYIVFERAKTENSTRANPKSISVYINEDIQRIITQRGNPDKSPGNFIFPILEHGVTPLRQYELLELFIRSINDWMDKIRKKLKIERRVSTYVARHTFSTVMKRSGVSTEFIQEALGHTDIRTTENYLDSFEKEIKKEYAARLLAFDIS
ncbi:MAG TPA: site-specific integrase [Chitinophagaceae bacterium]|nr:site-specific integrase [Chitinophagaceae bacterium]